jgi:hypothetical protein
MPRFSRGFRRVVGRVLLKLDERGRTFVAEEKDAAEFLVAERLVEFHDYPLPAEQAPTEESHQAIKMASPTHHALTPKGVAFVRQHEANELVGGEFRLPSEEKWLDTALGKWLARIIKLIVAVGVAFYIGVGLAFLGCKKEEAKPKPGSIRVGRSVRWSNPWRPGKPGK